MFPGGKGGSLNLLELSEPVKACNGIALPFFFTSSWTWIKCICYQYVRNHKQMGWSALLKYNAARNIQNVVVFFFFFTSSWTWIKCVCYQYVRNHKQNVVVLVCVMWDKRNVFHSTHRFVLPWRSGLLRRSEWRTSRSQKQVPCESFQTRWYCSVASGSVRLIPSAGSRLNRAVTCKPQQ
jgi:hypothetical protein